jgi:glycosyltransferase involved in cell wall biosynthesis
MLNNDIILSVCVVTYNQDHYIRDCLSSIVEQKTSFPFEIIVADDCSTDQTREIILEFAKRYPNIVKPLFRKKNLGAVENYLDVHNGAKGTYVAHIDGDDLMLPGKLQKQVDFLSQNSGFSAVWHRVNLFDDAGGFFSGDGYDYSFFKNGVITLSHALRLGSFGAHSSCMYRREARKTRKADFPIIDLFFTWEYLCSGEGKMLDDVLGAYRVAAHGSIMQNLNMRRINAHHARHYLKLVPDQRQNIFVFALLNFLIDLKNRRPTLRDFAKLTIDSFALVSPFFIWQSAFEVRKLISHPLRYENCS